MPRAFRAILVLASLVAATPAPAQTDTASADTQGAPPAAPDSSAPRDTARGDTARGDSVAAAGTAPSSASLPFLVAAGVLGLATLGFIGLFVAEVGRGRPLEVESHWGGFGGGLGGWRISPALTYFVAALAFGTMLTVLAARLLPADRADEAGDDTKAAKAASTTAPARDSAAAAGAVPP